MAGKGCWVGVAKVDGVGAGGGLNGSKGRPGVAEGICGGARPRNHGPDDLGWLSLDIAFDMQVFGISLANKIDQGMNMDDNADCEYNHDLTSNQAQT